jgi:hypothetical protein
MDFFSGELRVDANSWVAYWLLIRKPKGGLAEDLTALRREPPQR